MILGLLLLAIGYVLWFWFMINFSRPTLNQPLVFHSPVFVIFGTVIWIGLSLGGIVLVFRASVTAGTWTLIVIAVVWFISRGFIRRFAASERARQ